MSSENKTSGNPEVVVVKKIRVLPENLPKAQRYHKHIFLHWKKTQKNKNIEKRNSKFKSYVSL